MCRMSCKTVLMQDEDLNFGGYCILAIDQHNHLPEDIANLVKHEASGATFAAEAW